MPPLATARYAVRARYRRSFLGRQVKPERIDRVIPAPPGSLEHERKGKRGLELYHVVTGFVSDALGLPDLALVHVPEALPAIERGFKRAREK